MRFACLIVLAFAFPVAADDAAKIAALEAKVARLEAVANNLEVRLLAAELFGARAGYVPPVGPLKAEAAPGAAPPVTVQVMPARRPLLAKLFGGCKK